MLFRTLVMIHQCFPLQVQSVCSFSVTANQVKHNLPVFGFLWLHNINSVPTSSSSSCAICRLPTSRHTYCIGPDLWLGPENSFVSTLPWIYFKTALHALASVFWPRTRSPKSGVQRVAPLVGGLPGCWISIRKLNFHMYMWGLTRCPWWPHRSSYSQVLSSTWHLAEVNKTPGTTR